MVYPGAEMVRFATLPGMWERTITIGLAGKVWSATGWKIGWSVFTIFKNMKPNII
jgi:kynurenine aminotransferase